MIDPRVTDKFTFKAQQKLYEFLYIEEIFTTFELKYPIMLLNSSSLDQSTGEVKRVPPPIIKPNITVTDPPAMSCLKKITSPPIVKPTPSVVQFTPTAKDNPKKMSTIVDIVNRKRAKSLWQEKCMHHLARMMDYSSSEENDDIEILP